MKKKIVSCVLVASLSFSIGCYSAGMVTKEEFKAKHEQVDITVYTKDSLEYKFSKGYYRIQGDTLLGLSRVLIAPSSPTLSFQERVALLESGAQGSAKTRTRDSVVESVAFADITSLRVKELDLPLTLIASALGGGLLFFLFLVITIPKGT